MRKIFYFANCLIALAILASCSSKEEKAVKAFAEDFGEKASENEIDELIDVYPGLEQTDSIALDYNKGDIEVSKNDDGTYDVMFNDDVTINVKLTEDDKVEVIESTGLFAYRKNELKFAKGIGALPEKRLSDSKKAVVMNNINSVVAYLMDEYLASLKGAISVSGPTITRDIDFMMDSGSGYYTLKNNTDHDISINDYTLNVDYYTYDWEGERKSRKVEKGGDIPAGGTYKWKFSFTGHTSPGEPIVSMREPTQDEFLVVYKAKGDEYARYKKAHPEDVKKSKILNDGPYYLAGKVGGKYPIHMTLDKGMKTGSYYYDKYGPKNPLTLNISSFDPKNGKITLQEMNKDDNITGEFNGTLTYDSFEGTMTSHAGQSYNCKFTVSQ